MLTQRNHRTTSLIFPLNASQYIPSPPFSISSLTKVDVKYPGPLIIVLSFTHDAQEGGFPPIPSHKHEKLSPFSEHEAFAFGETEKKNNNIFLITW